jgi:hypothetical protein
MSFADFLGQSETLPGASWYGTSGQWYPGVGWTTGKWDDKPYTVGYMGTSNPGDWNTNGDTLDEFWVIGPVGWWDLGASYASVAVFGSQCWKNVGYQHYLNEGLEYRVFGANTLWDDGTLGPQAIVTDIYLDGWRVHNPAEDINGNGWCSDDISTVLDLGGSYRYIRISPWFVGPTGVYQNPMPEINAVSGIIPTPSAILLGALGLSCAGWKLRGRKEL